MSSKSIAEKLLVKPGTTVWSSHAERLELIEPLPPDLGVADRPDEATVAVVFADDAASLRTLLAADAGRLAEARALWVAYPKGNRADINRDTLWPIMAQHGMRPIGQVSLNDVWSAMRFRPDKPGEAPFTGGAKNA